jgi:hypothetical protein
MDICSQELMHVFSHDELAKQRPIAILSTLPELVDAATSRVCSLENKRGW